MELAGREHDPVGEAAVGHDAEGEVVLAAVAVAGAARVAALAVEIGLHGAAVARTDPGHAFADRQHLHAQLMAGDPRIGCLLYTSPSPRDS